MEHSAPLFKRKKIMTKFLNESGFRRIVKAIKDALAGKQDKKLVVTVTGVGSDNITADKTYNEILSAYNNGADILVDDGYGYFFHLIAFDSGWFVFMMKPYDEANFDYYLLVSPQNVWTSRIWVAQEKLISGTNIKTVNNNSLLGSGNISIEPNEIASITTTESTASGGNNTVTINTTDGTSKTFNVKNGKDGADGVSLGEVALVQTTGDSEESVMSQKAVTEYGRKVTAEDLNGTSDWIRTKLTVEGWEFNKSLGTGTITDDVGYCVSPLIPASFSGSNYYWWVYMHASNNSRCLWFYDSSGTKIAYQSSNFLNFKRWLQNLTFEYIRFTLPMDSISLCFMLNQSTGDIIFDGRRYLKNLCKGYIQQYGELQNLVINPNICDLPLDYKSLGWYDGVLSSTGVESENSGTNSHQITPFIDVSTADFINLSNPSYSNLHVWICFYDEQRNFLYGGTYAFSNNEDVVYPRLDNVHYIRLYMLNNSIENTATISIILKNAITPTFDINNFQYNIPQKIERGTSLQTNLRRIFTKLNQRQVNILNSNETMSIRFLVYASDMGIGNQDWRYLELGPIGKTANNDVDLSTYFTFKTTFWGCPYLFGRVQNDTNGCLGKFAPSSTPHPVVATIVLNKKTGNVRYYRGADLIVEETSDDYKCEKFISDEGLFTINSGGHNARIYGIQLYDCDIMKFTLGESYLIDNVNNACESEISQDLKKNYNKSHNFDYDTATNVYTSEYTITTDGNVRTQTRNDGKAGRFFLLPYNSIVCREYKIEFTINKPFYVYSAGYSSYCLYDSNGLLIEENIKKNGETYPAGTYTILFYNFHFSGGIWTTEDGATVTYTRQVRYAGAVGHFKCDTLYDGKVFDDVTNEYYTFYTNVQLTLISNLHSISKMPLRSTYIGDLTIPHYIGETKLTSDGKVYIANKDYTWKQINNS